MSITTDLWSCIAHRCHAALPSRVNFNTHKSQTYFAFIFLHLHWLVSHSWSSQRFILSWLNMTGRSNLRHLIYQPDANAILINILLNQIFPPLVSVSSLGIFSPALCAPSIHHFSLFFLFPFSKSALPLSPPLISPLPGRWQVRFHLSLCFICILAPHGCPSVFWESGG